MTVQIDNIFNAGALSIQGFVATPGQGCYIPAYQRPYAWDQDNVDRLFEDVINGLNHLMTRTEAISFLGTIIAIHDITHVTVKPVYKAEVAQKVMTVIDGQQRISTSVMINVGLHALITQVLKRLGTAGGEEFDWAREQAQQALAELWTTFVLEQAVGTPPIYRFYPRVIRALVDVWSKKQSQAVYASPIAALIWAYINHAQGEKKQEAFTYRVLDATTGKPDPRHQPITEVFGYIGQQLNRITNGRNPDRFDFPDIQQAISKPDYIESLWAFPAPDAVVKFVNEGSDHRLYGHYTQLLRALVFFKYFCTRVALTVVTTRTEDDAFDMFEALNTTGEPLTAFETFRPKVIESETLEAFESSPSHDALERIEQYLDAFRKADDRQRATSEMLIPYALAETGSKLQKNLSDQRRYLRDSFDKLQSLEEKRGAVSSMASLAAFMETGWNLPLDTTPDLEGAPQLDEVTGFAFQALRQLKHNISIAALARFYDELRKAPPEDKDGRAGDLFDAIKATTAFSMLWRGAKGGTENIDSIYRGMLERGDPDNGIPPLAKRPGDKIGAASIANYQRMLRKRLFKEFASKEDWVRAASRIPIYDHSSVVAKFLLIAASHDTAIDPKEPGLLIHGRAGLGSTMRTEAWRSDATFSVEHVAPKTRSAEWAEDVYEQAAFHRLGNLTLLPVAANSYVGNRSWIHKRLLYRYFSAETDADAKTVLADFDHAGLKVSLSGEVLLGSSPYMPMCRAIAAFPADWQLEFIERRSQRLAELAYDNIIGWLGTDPPA
jgi:hypothetical protein